MQCRDITEPGQAATMGAEEFRVEVLGISRTAFYQAAKRDALPVPVIRVGRRLLFSRRLVEALLNRRHGDPGSHSFDHGAA